MSLGWKKIRRGACCHDERPPAVSKHWNAAEIESQLHILFGDPQPELMAATLSSCWVLSLAVQSNTMCAESLSLPPGALALPEAVGFLA